jgi:hypothetical protein
MSVRSPFDALFDTDDAIDQKAREAAQDVQGPRQAEGDPPSYRCRICALTAATSAYCPRCLADTMVLVLPPGQARRGRRGSRGSPR